MRKLLLIPLFLALLACAALAEENKYSVRDVGFVDVETRPYRLVLLAKDPAAPAVKKQQADRTAITPESRVMLAKECQGSMDKAAKKIGMQRITHHDLRHLFATTCIESGVDVPTVARWLGHRDGGVLAMRVYTNHRKQHSAQQALRVSFQAA